MTSGPATCSWSGSSKLDRLGYSLPRLLAIVNGPKKRGVTFRPLTDLLDTKPPHGELLFFIFGRLRSMSGR